MDSQEMVFVDIETTGGSLSADRILEIGLIRVKNNKVVKTYNTVVDPEMSVSEYIKNFTGITQSEIESAPTFYSINEEVKEFLDGAVFVAHNVDFDYAFILKEFQRLGITLHCQKLCTVKLSRVFYPNEKHHNLDEIISRHGIECENRHRAFGDAKAIYDFYLKIIEKFNYEIVLSKIKDLQRGAALPQGFAINNINDVPETFGVYIFYGENEIPLYIGKSNNIKKRVMSHFYVSKNDAREFQLAQQVKRLEWIVTSGELSALLKESELVKEFSPLYNKKLRKLQNYTWIRNYKNGDGYECAELTTDFLDSSNLASCVGVFKNKKAAENVLMEARDQKKLCTSLLGLSSHNKECFHFQIGECKGACLKKEKPLFYNIRFIEAFFKYRVRKWPFSEKIIIYENNDEFEKYESFVVNNWCLEDLAFNYDTYVILNRYLSNPKHKTNIKFVSEYANLGLFDSD